MKINLNFKMKGNWKLQLLAEQSVKTLPDIKPVRLLKKVGTTALKYTFLVDFFDVLGSSVRFTDFALQSLKEGALWKGYRNVLKPLRQPAELHITLTH